MVPEGGGFKGWDIGETMGANAVVMGGCERLSLDVRLDTVVFPAIAASVATPVELRIES
jgi:hypothetical protein